MLIHRLAITLILPASTPTRRVPMQGSSTEVCCQKARSQLLEGPGEEALQGLGHVAKGICICGGEAKRGIPITAEKRQSHDLSFILRYHHCLSDVASLNKASTAPSILYHMLLIPAIEQPASSSSLRIELNYDRPGQFPLSQPSPRRHKSVRAMIPMVIP